MWEARKSYNSCPSKLQSQHSAENLAGTQAGKSLLYVNKGNVNVNKGKELLVGLGGDDSNFMIAPPIIVGVWPMAVLLWQHVECSLLLKSICVHFASRKSSITAQ